MTAYRRSPKKATAKCTVPGCTWLRTYFEKNGIAPEIRAHLALNGHIGAKHCGMQAAQKLRPVMR